MLQCLMPLFSFVRLATERANIFCIKKKKIRFLQYFLHPVKPGFNFIRHFVIFRQNITAVKRETSTTSCTHNINSMASSFKITVATGYAGLMPRQWSDTQEWTVEVTASDSLATVIEKARAAGAIGVPTDLSQFLVAPSTSTRLVSDHGNLRKPQLSATLAENGLGPDSVLRWWNGMMD